MPRARTVSHAILHAPACVGAVTSMTFSPFVPKTLQPVAVPTSPMDQPARCKRSADSSTEGKLGQVEGRRFIGTSALVPLPPSPVPLLVCRPAGTASRSSLAQDTLASDP